MFNMSAHCVFMASISSLPKNRTSLTQNTWWCYRRQNTVTVKAELPELPIIGLRSIAIPTIPTAMFKSGSAPRDSYSGSCGRDGGIFLTPQGSGVLQQLCERRENGAIGYTLKLKTRNVANLKSLLSTASQSVQWQGRVRQEHISTNPCCQNGGA